MMAKLETSVSNQYHFSVLERSNEKARWEGETIAYEMVRKEENGGGLGIW